MADPFSIVAGTAGLTDVCIKLLHLIKQGKDSFQAVDDELKGLCNEVERLRSVNDLVEDAYKAELSLSSDPTYQKIFASNWYATEVTLGGCREVVEKIDQLLTDVLKEARGKHVKIDRLRIWLKQQSKEDAFNALRQKLSAHQNALQTSLQAVNL